MRRLILTCFAFTMFCAACTKTDARDESVLYGTWVNSNVPGDTLGFLLVNRKNIIRFNSSFIPGAKADSLLFSYTSGKLAVAFTGSNQPLSTITSFTWIEQRKSFDILGYQLYPIMSSSTTHFRYTKID